MQVTVDVPDGILRQAEARGIAVEALVLARLSETPDIASRPGFTSFGKATKSTSEAADDIRALRRGQTLGVDVTIAQLIEEGRQS